jgi:phosphoribosylformylglycinamidine synthase
VRTGKYLELDVEGGARDTIAARIKEMCDKLLANPVIEEYEIVMSEE